MTCRPRLDLAACVAAGEHAYPGAPGCEALGEPGAEWPAAPSTDKPIVYVAQGADGDGSGPDRALGMLQTALDRHPGQAIVAVVGRGRFEIEGDDLVPGTEVLAADPLRTSIFVAGSIAGRFVGLSLSQQGAKLRVRGDLRVGAARLDAHTLEVGAGATATLERVFHPGAGFTLVLEPGGRASIERSNLALTGAQVAVGAGLRVVESRLALGEGGLAVRGQVTLDRAWVEQTQTSTGALVRVSGAAGELTLERSRLRTEQRTTPALVEVASGARARLLEVTLDFDAIPERGDGLSVSGGTVEAQDLLVRGGHHGLFARGSPRLHLTRAAFEGLDNAGLSVRSSTLAAVDLTVDGVERVGESSGRGVRLIDGTSASLERVEIVGAREWGIALGHVNRVQATLRDVSIVSPRHGVLVYSNNTGAAFERLRVEVPGMAFKSYAAATLADVELISTSSTSEDAVVRVCQRIPGRVVRLRIDGGGRPGPLMDVLASASFTSQMEDVDLARGAVGLVAQPSVGVSSLGLERALIADVGVGVELRGRVSQAVWSSTVTGDPCDREWRDPLRVPEPGAGVPALVSYRGVMARVGTCLEAATAADRCGFAARGLVLTEVEECPRCER